MRQLALALLLAAGMASPVFAQATVPSKAVPGTHDCSRFYPEAALRNNDSGDVLVTYDVGTDGTISNVTVTKSSGYPLLDHAAVDCVSTAWRNTPAMRDGVAVASPGHQAIVRFALTEPPPAAAVPAPAPAPEESDLPFLIAGAGVLAVIIGGLAVLFYRRRRRA